MTEQQHSQPGVRATLVVHDNSHQEAPLVEIEAQDLPEALSEAAEQLAYAAGPLQLALHGLAGWSPSTVDATLRWAAQLTGLAAVEIDGHRASDPFEAALAALSGPAAPASHAATRQAALTAAALWHQDFPDAPATRLADRLHQVGVRGVNVQQVASDVREAISAAATSSAESNSSKGWRIATTLLAERRDARQLQEMEPALLFHRETWWEYLGSHWAHLSRANVRAEITSCAQRHGIAVTSTDINDALTNLQGLCRTDDWSLSPPFDVTAVEPVYRVEPRRHLILANGALSLADPFADSDCDDFDSPGVATVRVVHHPRMVVPTTLGYRYDPRARYPEFARFLDRILPQRDDSDRRQQVLQEAAGYTLLDDARFETAVVFVGEGANGKSTWLKVLEHLLGHDNVSHLEYQNIDSDNHLINLEGKLANIAHDLGYFGQANEGRLKQLISGEPLTVDRKFLSSITLNSFATLLFACNQLPNIVDSTAGVWRRLLVIPFEEQIPDSERDPSLAQRIIDNELPGVLNWALEGRFRLLQQGGFTYCAYCEAAKREHQVASDSFLDFATECLHSDPGFGCIVDDLYNFYYRYTVKTGRRNPLGQANFSKRVKRMYQTDRFRLPASADSQRPRVYPGVSLTDTGRDHFSRIYFGAPSEIERTIPPNWDQQGRSHPGL